jgi:hypothetical protein
MSNFTHRSCLLHALCVPRDLCVNSFCFSLPHRESAKMKYHI